MDRQLDEVLKSYFSDRLEPTQEIKSELHEKFTSTLYNQATKLCWLIALYTFLFSAAVSIALLIFTNSEFLTLIFMANFLLSFLINVIIILFCRNSKEKGGEENAPVYH